MDTSDILAAAEAMREEDRQAVAQGPWIPRELAAQRAEETACLVPDAESCSEEWLDAWVMACETVAARLRAVSSVRGVK